MPIRLFILTLSLSFFTACGIVPLPYAQQINKLLGYDPEEICLQAHRDYRFVAENIDELSNVQTEEDYLRYEHKYYSDIQQLKWIYEKTPASHFYGQTAQEYCAEGHYGESLDKQLRESWPIEKARTAAKETRESKEDLEKAYQDDQASEISKNYKIVGTELTDIMLETYKQALMPFAIADLCSTQSNISFFIDTELYHHKKHINELRNKVWKKIKRQHPNINTKKLWKHTTTSKSYYDYKLSLNRDAGTKYTGCQSLFAELTHANETNLDPIDEAEKAIKFRESLLYY